MKLAAGSAWCRYLPTVVRCQSVVSQLLSGRRDIRIFFQPPQQIVIEKTRELSEHVGGLPVEGILKLNHFQLHDEMRLNDSGIEQVDIFYDMNQLGET